MGVVAIPIGDIERVETLPGDDPTLVTVTVRNGDRITPLVTVGWPAFPDRHPPRSGPFGNPVGDVATEICKHTYENVCNDTTTTGGGVDDTICGVEWADMSCKND